MENNEVKDNELDIDTQININVFSDIECESECLCPWFKKKNNNIDVIKQSEKESKSNEN